MKYQTNELTGAMLDAAVAKALGGTFEFKDGACWAEYGGFERIEFRPSTSWAIGGPIIERERIGVLPAKKEVSADRNHRRRTGSHFTQEPDGWAAGYKPVTHQEFEWVGACASGPTPLIAAMRAFVASKLGDEVEL